MNLFRRSILIFAALMAGLPTWADPCGKDLLSNLILPPSNLLQKVQALEPDLIRGYHLPDEYIQGYYARRIEPYLAKPNYREVPHPEVLYRGMYLTVDELKSVLQKGMTLDKVNWTAAGGGISFSSDIQEAISYLFNQNSRPNGLGVVFQTKKTSAMVLADDPVLNSTRTIFKTHADVKPEEIQNVYVWGQYGLESLEEIQKKALNHKVVPHGDWTGVFNSGGFSR